MASVKLLTPTQLRADQEALIARAEKAGRSMNAQELRLFEALVIEEANKRQIADEAKLVRAREQGRQQKVLADQKRIDARNVHEKIISHGNASDPEDKTKEIKRRHEITKRSIQR